MSCLEGLVRERTLEGERALQAALGNWLIAGTVRSFLPQTWVIATEQETLSVHADADGRISLRQGLSVVRDGAVTIRHDTLAESIRTGKSPGPGSYEVSFYTDRGRAAFEQLSKFFGL